MNNIYVILELIPEEKDFFTDITHMPSFTCKVKIHKKILFSRRPFKRVLERDIFELSSLSKKLNREELSMLGTFLIGRVNLQNTPNKRVALFRLPISSITRVWTRSLISELFKMKNAMVRAIDTAI